MFATLFGLVKSLKVVVNLPISKLSISDFKLAKSAFLESFDVSTLF